jgi:hypothetical protein
VGRVADKELVMRRRIGRLWGIAVAIAMPALLMPVDAGAIIGGELDGSKHPNVGLIVALDQKGNLLDACTGTLISQTVVLTAAHCLAPGVQYKVSFKPTLDLSGNNNRFIGVAAIHGNSTYDVGVLVLARSANKVYPGIKPALLPARGALDNYRTKTPDPYFSHVGYGVDRLAPPPDLIHFTRRTSTSPLKKVTNTLLYTQPGAHGEGSICSGDSGGPVFSERVVVALGNFVNGHCQGANGGPRLDIEPTRRFLRTYVTVP